VIGFGESCPRSYVTGESVESARDFCSEHIERLKNNITGLDSLSAWVTEHRSDINSHPAAWCALELALLDALAKTSEESVESLLSQRELEGIFQYTAVIGDMDDDAFSKLAQRYIDLGFLDFKIKLSGQLSGDKSKLHFLANNCPEQYRLRLDANNLWRSTTKAINYLRALEADFFAIEEPLAANNYDQLLELHQALNTKIILDESFLRIEQFKHLATKPSPWIINIRVSKMGGLLRGLDIVNSAKALKIPIIIGAQVGETSLLTRAALTLAQSAGDLGIAQEGAVGTYLLKDDICEQVLMFGPGGKLNMDNYPVIKNAGFGLKLRPALSFIEDF